MVGSLGQPPIRLQSLRDRPRDVVQQNVGAVRARRPPRPRPGDRQIDEGGGQATPLLTLCASASEIKSSVLSQF